MAQAPQPTRFVTQQVEGVNDTLKTLLFRQRRVTPRVARIGERDQVSGQIPAVDRGYVLWI
ncbi:MAG TPA: hypothetical protein VK281_06155, partial [Xanthobacteraceae bacterium]|nr:hypothetical protein [Xanthobacteraceae bacterium]